jgi:arylformamidase
LVFWFEPLFLELGGELPSLGVLFGADRQFLGIDPRSREDGSSVNLSRSTVLKSQSPAWFNAMYNNRELVPKSLEHLQFWQEASRRVLLDPSRRRVEMAYGHGEGENLDIYEPSDEFKKGKNGKKGSKRPVLVFVHGGYWRSLSKEDHAFLVPAWSELGVVSVVPNYALCPSVSIKHIALQMVNALSWIHQHIDQFGGDPSNIHVVGHSAGGHLAALLLSTQWAEVGAHLGARLPSALIQSAMSISGLHELESIRKTPFLNETLQLNAADALALSPAFMPSPHGGQLACVVGGLESEEFKRQCRLMRERWGKSHVPVSEEIEGLHHFSILESFLDPHSRLVQLLKQTLRL